MPRMRHPAALPAIALCAGITAGIFLSVSIPPALLVCAWLGAAGAFVSCPHRAATIIVTAGFAMCGVALGRAADSSSRQTPAIALIEPHVARGEHQLFGRVEGRLRSDVVRGASGVTLDVVVERIHVNGVPHPAVGGALIGVGGDIEAGQILHWRGGRRVAFPATLRRPTRYLNPGVPDAQRQMAWRGTSLVGSVKSARLIEVTARGGIVSEALASVRACVRHAVAGSVGAWSERSAAIVLAILIGDRAGLSDAVERRLQEAGTYHVIAISGGNIAIVAGLCVFILRALRLGPRAGGIVVIAVLAAYACVVEGGSSVGRATLMAAIYFAARLRDHRTAPLNAVALTAAVLACVDPLQVVDAGFWLTFGATMGILAGVAAFGGMYTRTGWPSVVVSLAAATTCAEIALLPVSAYVFSRVTFAGLIVNFAAIPLMTIVQIAGMAAAASWAVWPSGARAMGWVAHIAVEGLIRSAVVVDWMPWLTRRLAPPPLFVVSVYYASVLALLALHGRSARASIVGWAARPIAGAAFAACGLWIVAVVPMPFPPTPTLLRVTFLDVGQGDAALVQFPNGRTLSVDTGGTHSATFDMASRVVSPAFWALGVRRLDYLSFTHGDADHVGGAPSLFRDFQPFEVWEGVPVPPHAPTRELRGLADRAGATWRTLQSGDRLSVGPVDLVVHHPPSPDWERQRVRNDDSEVLEIRHGAVSFVLTGDIGRETELAIAPRFLRAALRIVKVPHHGSATSSSSAFLDALRPDIAVVSAGRGNLFGHPSPAVLDRYRRAGAAIYRTDQDGAVIIETDGATVRVRTFTGRRLTLTTKGR